MFYALSRFLLYFDAKGRQKTGKNRKKVQKAGK